MPARLKHTAKKIIGYENSALAIVLVALIAGFGVFTKGLSVRPANLMNIILQSSIRGVAAIGELFVILSANIDISVGGIGLFCALLGARLMTFDPKFQLLAYPVPLGTTIFLMLLMGTGWGATNGLISSRVGIPSLIVTLGMWEITKGAAYQVAGGQSIANLPEGLAWIGQGEIGGFPVPGVIFISAAVIAYFVLRYTTFGRNVYASGGNPVAAWLSGINVKYITLCVFLISGFMSGLAGVIITSRVMSAAMRTLSGLELDALASVFVGGVSLAGGKGTVIGVVLGVFIVGVINNSMSVMGANPAVFGVVKGIIIIAAVTIDYIRRRR
jgi:ribose/xylose/arabinose/galactoside ABC-type transport system permease subunit